MAGTYRAGQCDSGRHSSWRLLATPGNERVMKTVVFACVQNAGRSQMAAAFFNQMADPALATSISAGTSPAAKVQPEVVQAMHEVDIDISSAQPKLLTRELASQADLLITMGCGDE